MQRHTFFLKKKANGLSVWKKVVPLHADYYQGGQKMPSMHVRIACSLARQAVREKHAERDISSKNKKNKNKEWTL